MVAGLATALIVWLVVDVLVVAHLANLWGE